MSGSRCAHFDLVLFESHVPTDVGGFIASDPFVYTVGCCLLRLRAKWSDDPRVDPDSCRVDCSRFEEAPAGDEWRWNCIICGGEISASEPRGGMVSHLTDPPTPFRYHYGCIESAEQLERVVREKLEEVGAL